MKTPHLKSHGEPKPGTVSIDNLTLPLAGIEEYLRIKMLNAYMEGVNRGALFVVENERFPNNQEKSEMKKSYEER